jgi:hypothetical protein
VRRANNDVAGAEGARGRRVRYPTSRALLYAQVEAAGRPRNERAIAPPTPVRNSPAIRG